MTEIIFLVEEDPEGGYSAQALGESIFTQAEDLIDLRMMVRDAVQCHFEDDKRPKLIRLSPDAEKKHIDLSNRHQ